MILHEDALAFGNSNYFLQFTDGTDSFAEEHAHDFYEIIMVADGGCDHLINGKVFSCKQNTVAVLRPGDTHKLMHQLPHTRLMLLSVKRVFMNDFLKIHGKALCDRVSGPLFSNYIPAGATVGECIRFALQTLALTDAYEKEMYYTLLLGKILTLFAERKAVPVTAASRTEEQLFSALDQMQKPENIMEGVPALQRLSGYSRSQLCRLMKKYTGCTPREYVQHRRMDLAYDLLLHTAYSLSEIAEHIGFSSSSHFIAAFKSAFGITPSQIRKCNPGTLFIRRLSV